MEGNTVRVDGTVIPLDEATAALGRTARGKLEVGIRPMYLELRSESGEAGVEATVTMIEDQGSYRIVTLMLGGHILRAKVPEGKPVSEGTVWIHFPKPWIRLFADGRVIT
jgi:glycerol transport system ATP-binding protein